MGGKHFLVLLSLFLISNFVLGRAPYSVLADDEDLEYFKSAQWLNGDEVASSVGFFNHSSNPYPSHRKGYGVEIDPEMTCWLVFRDDQQKTYDMITAPSKPRSNYGAFLSHHGPCGVCSNLQDLGVYITKRDLTTPVRRCGLYPLKDGKLNCLRKLGFTERCVHIWYWNTIFTRKSCLNVCVRYIRASNNQPVGKYNPCKPAEDTIAPEEEFVDDELVDRDPEHSLLLSGTIGTITVKEVEDITIHQYQDRDAIKNRLVNAGEVPNKMASSAKASSPTRMMQFVGKKITTFNVRGRRKPKGCRNKINNGPACHETQWQNGPDRLNPCLQCDECNSGPMFKKVSGRTRRNSGIVSAIARPGVPAVDHHYFTNKMNRLEL